MNVLSGCNFSGHDKKNKTFLAAFAESVHSALILRGAEQGQGILGSKTDARMKEAEGEQSIVCAVCLNKLTTNAKRIKVNGSHLHTFFNPHGIVFEIGCFLEATGCLKYGAPSGDFSWFSGFDWSFVCCAVCGEHLGWFYQSGNDDAFYGFILEKLKQM